MQLDDKTKKTAKKTGSKLLSRTWKFFSDVAGELTQGTIKVAKSELKAHTVVISDGKIFVDGKEVSNAVATDVTIENAENINLFVIGDVTVNGDVNDLEADGNVVVAGNIGGDVESRGGVQCGNIAGDVESQGNVVCGSVGGDIEANGNVTCEDVNGDIDSTGNVSAKKIRGDVECGGDIKMG